MKIIEVMVDGIKSKNFASATSQSYRTTSLHLYLF